MFDSMVTLESSLMDRVSALLMSGDPAALGLRVDEDGIIID